jgi:hypothetical protein
MPWRRKPADCLEYWEGPVNRDAGFKAVLVYCVGPERPRNYHESCHHRGRLNLKDLPDWDWYDISAHLRCTKCGAVGYVDTPLNWGDVINFSKGVC